MVLQQLLTRANMSVNDPTIELGDPTTAITSQGSTWCWINTIVVDKLEGFTAGDAIGAASGIPSVQLSVQY